MKERELKAFILNTQKDQKVVESEIEYYQNEMTLKKNKLEQKKAELLFEL